VTNEEALTHLANQTAESVSGVLQMFFGDGVTMSSAAIVPRGTPPLGAMPTPTIVSNISYTDGATGGNLFAIPVTGARKLAAAMMGAMAEEGPAEDELSELEMSAVGEAANQMLAAAAAATSAVLGQEVEIDPPETRVLKDLSRALEGYQQTQWMTSVSFQLGDEPCRLVQLVPQAFIVRMTQALQEKGEEIQVGAAPPGGGHGGMDVVWLEGARLRLSGELGRTRLPAARVVDLAGGSIVPLDRHATDPIDLFINGMPFARGRLVLVDESDWAVRIESIIPTTGSTSN
jgi:flagellar motor switch protein FliN/FliY